MAFDETLFFKTVEEIENRRIGFMESILEYKSHDSTIMVHANRIHVALKRLIM
jgi:hypothetical protein